jgi:CBS domain-containing protein
MDLLHGARSGLDGLTARELAATEPVTIGPASPLGQAVQLMEQHEVTHLVVVDAGRPVGVLSTLDVAGVLAWGRG